MSEHTRDDHIGEQAYQNIVMSVGLAQIGNTLTVSVQGVCQRTPRYAPN